ncbi:MAG: ubiquinone/menaquinone biosynthesis C-methylase UbiE [Paracoccaceae bacterium]|jgi:ubiquinone/menaquinone biosynthesis C-methylase UbiE
MPKEFGLSSKAVNNQNRESVLDIFTTIAEATSRCISLPQKMHMLNVACGTGAVARAIATRLFETSKIIGADLNSAIF